MKNGAALMSNVDPSECNQIFSVPRKKIGKKVTSKLWLFLCFERITHFVFGLSAFERLLLVLRENVRDGYDHVHDCGHHDHDHDYDRDGNAAASEISHLLLWNI
jgi:hypothetical protein